MVGAAFPGQHRQVILTLQTSWWTVGRQKQRLLSEEWKPGQEALRLENEIRLDGQCWDAKEEAAELTPALNISQYSVREGLDAGGRLESDLSYNSIQKNPRYFEKQ